MTKERQYMNETLKVLLGRRSVRNFRPEQLKKEDLDAIVEAGLYAPSAKNLQETKLVVAGAVTSLSSGVMNSVTLRSIVMRERR